MDAQISAAAAAASLAVAAADAEERKGDDAMISFLTEAELKFATTVSGKPLFEGQLPKERMEISRIYKSKWKLRFIQVLKYDFNLCAKLF